jgi:hypothetical protein
LASGLICMQVRASLPCGGIYFTWLTRGFACGVVDIVVRKLRRCSGFSICEMTVHRQLPLYGVVLTVLQMTAKGPSCVSAFNSAVAISSSRVQERKTLR